MGLIETILGLGIFFVVVLIILAVLSYVFWLVMFIDALKRRDMLWIALFIFCALTGVLSGIIAAVYYWEVYKK